MSTPHSAFRIPHSKDLPDLEATERFGRSLGERLFPNAVIALIGPLGAGKTHLTRAIAEGLGISNPALVTSPTFTLVHEYPARLTIYHFDAYRLSGSTQFLDLGAEEYYTAGGVCLIEWADRVAEALPSEYLEVRIDVLAQTARRLVIRGHGATHDALGQSYPSGEDRSCGLG